jgi:hypothetical protein
MSTPGETATPGLRTRTRALYRQALETVFGDRIGIVLFLVGLVFFLSYWRIGVFINDSNTFVNTLVNVADGRLFLANAPYGAGLEAPGTHVAGGRTYGRNYGVVVAAVPILWAIESVATVADPKIAIVALWSLFVLGASVQLGTLLDRPRIAVAGSVAAVGLYLANVAVATPIEPAMYPVMALQLVTMFAAALSGVFLYRLVAAIYGRRLGIAVAGAALVATPIGFWASIPKRHAFTTLLALATVYALYESRRAATARESLVYRALAYVPVGLTAWIHAPEALLLFLSLLVVDLATADRNDPRTLAVVTGAFLVSLLPFLLTNALISGNPLQPPRLLTPYGESTGGVSLSTGGVGSSGFLATTPVGQLVDVTVVFGSLLTDGASVALTDSSRLFETFVRSGYQPTVAPGDAYDAINLTVVESAPLLAGLLALPLAVGKRLRTDMRGVLTRHLRHPLGAVDAVVLGYCLLLVLIYIPRLPNNAQVTVRYLHPLFPLGLYALARLPAVRTAFADHQRLVAASYLGSVLIGGQLLVLGLALTDPGLGEAIQLHAVLDLSLGLLLGVWAVAATLTDAVPDEAGAVLLALTAAAGTVFLVLSGIDYFDYAGDFALPIVRVLAELLTLV